MPGWAGGRNEVLTTLHLLYLSHQPSSLSQNGPRTWLFSNLLLVTTYVGTSQQIVLLNQEEERSHGCPNHPPAAVPITATMGLRDGRRRRWGSGEGGGSSAWEPDKGPEGSIPQARPRIRKIHNIPSFNLNHITEGCIQPLLLRRCAQMASLQL